jgi:hypothetical protein
MKTGDHYTAEIVRCHRNKATENLRYCVTIAYWVWDNEGYYLKFVSDRPFELKNHAVFWDMAKRGQKYLNKEYKKGGDR